MSDTLPSNIVLAISQDYLIYYTYDTIFIRIHKINKDIILIEDIDINTYNELYKQCVQYDDNITYKFCNKIIIFNHVIFIVINNILQIFIEKENATKQIAASTMRELLQKLSINPEEVLTIKNNQLVTLETKITEKDAIKLLSVISGG